MGGMPAIVEDGSTADLTNGESILLLLKP